MTTNRKIVLATGFTIVIIFSFVIISSLWKQSSLYKTDTPNTSTQEKENGEIVMEKSIIQTDNILDTSTWKSFKSKDANSKIVFKYPANWYIRETFLNSDSPNKPFTQVTLSNYNQDEISGSGAGLSEKFIRINILGYKNQKNAETLANQLGFTDLEKRDVNGIKLIRDSHVFNGPNEESRDNPRYYHDVTVLSNDTIGYELNFSPIDSELKNVVDLISDSLNFEISDNQSISTLNLSNETETIDFCGKKYQVDKILIKNINLGQTIAKISQEEAWICNNIELGKFQENGIGIAYKIEASKKNSYLITLFHKGNESEERDPFNQSPYLFRFDFQNNRVLYQSQIDGLFKSIGNIE